MNSSGIKRGLASSAIAALAVAGLPLFASSASAVAGDSWSQIAGGPVRNGNAAGGSVILASSSNAINPANVLVTAPDYTGANPIAGPNDYATPTTDVNVLSVTLLDGDPVAGGIQKFADGFYHYEALTAVTVSGGATKASFGLVEDVDASGTATAADPKTVVEVTPSGAPTAIDLSTAQPATVEGQAVTFNAEIKDAAGNLTQLIAGEEFDVTASGGAAIAPDAVLDSADFASGKATFTATPGIASPDTMTVTVAGSTPPAPSVTDSVTVQVFDNATITNDEFDLVTGADNWVAGTTPFGAPNDRQVRVDQTEVTFSFQSKDGADLDTVPDDANKVVGLLVSSATITINGKAPAAQPVVVPVMLDAAGKGTGSITLSGVTAGSTLSFQAPGSTIGATTLTFNRPSATSVTADQGVYVTKIGAPTSVTVSVKDQFGNPIGGPAQVSITRVPDAPRTANAGTTGRVTVGADGKATLSLPDAGTTAGTEDLDVNLYDDQFDATPATTADVAEINYTVDGLGADFLVGGATSDPAVTVVTPVYDSAAGVGDSVDLNVTGGTPGAPVKVTVDNGALVLKGAETSVDKGSATDTVTLDGTGSAVGAEDIRIVGTKTGIVTVTLESAGRTKTVKLTVAQPAAGPARVATARNIAVTAPEKATAGQVAVYTVKVTDAFGNPVSGVGADQLAFQVTGPANLQGTDAVTDANGELKVNVILTDNANSAVAVRATGVVNGTQQFGDAVNIVDGVAAPGISASVATASASVTDVVNIAELEKAVEEAEEAVEDAEDALAEAQDELAVAKTAKQAANQLVKDAKKDLKAAKKKHKGVKAAKAALRRAQADYKVASAEVTAANNAVTRAQADLTEAQEDLEQAQQELEDAQN